MQIETCKTVKSTLPTVIATRAYARERKGEINMSLRWCQQSVEPHKTSEKHAFSINT